MALGTYPIDYTEWPADLDAMAGRLERHSIVEELRQPIAERFYAGIRANFQSGTAGDGSAWPPHKPSTIARHGAHPLLILTGALLASAGGSAGAGSFVIENNSSITFGVSIPVGNHDLAAIHQYGAPRANIPPRPFYDPGETVLDEIGELIADYVEREVL